MTQKYLMRKESTGRKRWLTFHAGTDPAYVQSRPDVVGVKHTVGLLGCLVGNEI